MAEFEERKKFWHIFYSPLALIVLLVVFLLMARAMWKVYNHERTSAQDRERVENELIAINQHAAALKSRVDALETPEGVEDEIRSKFNVIKAGEGVVVIVDNASDVNATTAPAEEEAWWQKFGEFFGF